MIDFNATIDLSAYPFECIKPISSEIPIFNEFITVECFGYVDGIEVSENIIKIKGKIKALHMLKNKNISIAYSYSVGDSAEIISFGLF